ncbi:MAG: phospholipase D-like domain-containing protein [Pseudomonadota bacterium]
MRKSEVKDGLALRAIAGCHVVILAWSMPKEACEGCMGFAIHRTDHTEDEAYWMQGIKTFAETDPGFVAGSLYATNKHPIQGFTWSDFSAKPGHRYTYKVQALKGAPTSLTPYKETSVAIDTEDESGDGHNIYFNRGAAASQEYVRRFGKVPPDENDGADPRWAWLSRGAMESIENFVARAANAQFGLRVCAYEFRLDLFADLLKEAKNRGADIRILYDGGANRPDKNGKVFPRDENRETALAGKVKSLCKERVTRDDVKDPPIAHNKFIVLTKNNKAVAALTGSTNFSRGGVFGQSNVIHIVEDDAIAADYLGLWNTLEGNPDHGDLRADLSARNNIPAGLPPKGASTIFSPQTDLSALDWYAARAKAAPNALFMTFAFGMNDLFKDVYRTGAAGLRYALMDKLIPSGTRKEKRPAAIAEMIKIRKRKENRFAVGSAIRVNTFDRWLPEILTGLNTHVQYIHTKFMLIDPLGDDPIVITGSANFSDASTDENDENMLVIRGDKRVADIYVGEYMRLWNHYAFREWAESEAGKLKAGEKIEERKFKHLDAESKWWKPYFGDTDKSRQRAYFAGVA